MIFRLEHLVFHFNLNLEHLVVQVNFLYLHKTLIISKISEF